MIAAEIMTKPVVGIAPDASLAVAVDLMLRTGISGLPVLDGVRQARRNPHRGRSPGPQGARHHREAAPLACRPVEPRPRRGRVRPLSRQQGRGGDQRDVVTVAPDTPLDEIVTLMTYKRIKRLPDRERCGRRDREPRRPAQGPLALSLAKAPQATRDDVTIRYAILDELKRESWAPIALIEVGVHDGIAELSGSIFDEREGGAQGRGRERAGRACGARQSRLHRTDVRHGDRSAARGPSRHRSGDPLTADQRMLPQQVQAMQQEAMKDERRPPAAPVREEAPPGAVPPPARWRASLRPWSIPIIVTLVLLSLAAYFATPAVLGPRIVVAPVTRGDVVRTVVASGRIQTPFRVGIGSQVTGTVAGIPVSEGQVVHQGDVLIILENSEAEANVELADAAVAQAEARLKQLDEMTAPMAEEQLRQAEANLYNAQQQYDRAEKLHAGGYSAQSQFDEARRALIVAQALTRAARVQAASSRPGGTDQDVAETALRQARASLQAARAKLDYSSIRAPADGDPHLEGCGERGRGAARQGPDGAGAGGRDAVGRCRSTRISDNSPWPAGARRRQIAIPERNVRPRRSSYINPASIRRPRLGRGEAPVPEPPDFLRQDMTVSVDIEVRSDRPHAAASRPSGVAELTGPLPGAQASRRSRRARDRCGSVCSGNSTIEILDGLSRATWSRYPRVRGVLAGHRRARPVSHGQMAAVRWIAACGSCARAACEALHHHRRYRHRRRCIVFMSALLAGHQRRISSVAFSLRRPQIQLWRSDEVARPLGASAGPLRDRHRADADSGCSRSTSGSGSPGGDGRDARRDRVSLPASPAPRWPCAATRAGPSRLIGIEPEHYFRIVDLPD